MGVNANDLEGNTRSVCLPNVLSKGRKKCPAKGKQDVFNRITQ